MNILITAILLIFTSIALIGFPWLLISDYRLKKRENPVFDALVARVNNSTALNRNELVSLHDELVNWHKRTGLYGRDVIRYLSYLRGRIGVKVI